MLSPPRILVGAISDKNSGTAWKKSYTLNFNFEKYIR